MSQTNSIRRQRNFAFSVAVFLAPISYIAASLMHWWFSPIDYWMGWVAFFTGFGAAGLFITSVIMTFAHIHESRHDSD